MKPPRVYARGKYFWVQIHNSLTHSPDRKPITFEDGITVPLDIDLPAKISDNPDWWKKSKHRKAIATFIDDLQHRRNKTVRGEDTGSRAVRPKLPTLHELLKLYTETRDLESGTRAAKTKEYRDNALAFLLRFDPQASLRNVTRQQALYLRGWGVKEGYSSHTLAGYLSKLSSLFTFALELKLIDDNPFRRISVSIEPKEPRVISLKTEQRLYKFLYIHRRDLFFQIMFLRLEGFRNTESCNFKLSQLHDETENIHYFNPKPQGGGRWEIMPYSEAYKIYLKLYREYMNTHTLPVERDGYMFAFASKDTLRNYLQKACSYAKVEYINPHLLKSLYGQEIDDVCDDTNIVAALMHHSPITNLVAARHYLKKQNRIKMLRALNESQQPWISFLESLSGLQEVHGEYVWGNKSKRAAPKQGQ